MLTHKARDRSLLNEKERDRCFQNVLEGTNWKGVDYLRIAKKWHLRQVGNVSENWAILAYCTASSGNYLLTFWTTHRSHPQGSRSVPKCR
jgi:hypothetical protein